MNKVDVAKHIFVSELTEYANREYVIDKINAISANTLFLVTVNQVGIVKKFIVKIYEDESKRAVLNKEREIYHLLDGNSKHIRKMLAHGEMMSVKYAIFNYVEGDTFLSIIKSESGSKEDIKSYIRQIDEFIKECGCIKTSGAGEMGESNQGILPFWHDFLMDNLSRNKSILEGLSNKLERTLLGMLSGFIKRARDFIILNKDSYFLNIDTCLTPVDLNLSNFLVDKDKNIFVIDLESFVSGDILFAYGELFGHIYETNISSYFDKYWDHWSIDQASVVHLYAMISNLNVFLFCVLQANNDPLELKPWGNSNTFIDLMIAHNKYI